MGSRNTPDAKPAFTTIGEREIGGRRYIIRSDERLIARRRDGWELSELKAWSTADWMSLRLLDTAERRRAPESGERTPRMRVYQVGFSRKERRIAVNVFWGKLMATYPDVAQWVVERMRKESD